jgi:hypothetical protein
MISPNEIASDKFVGCNAVSEGKRVILGRIALIVTIVLKGSCGTAGIQQLSKSGCGRPVSAIGRGLPCLPLQNDPRTQEEGLPR